jgi:hypothetical protein
MSAAPEVLAAAKAAKTSGDLADDLYTTQATLDALSGQLTGLVLRDGIDEHLGTMLRRVVDLATERLARVADVLVDATLVPGSLAPASQAAQTSIQASAPASAAELVATGRALLSCWIHALPPEVDTVDDDIASPLQVSLGAICELLCKAEDAYADVRWGESGFGLHVMSARGLVSMVEEALWNVCIGETLGGPTVDELRGTACHALQLLDLASDALQAVATAQGGAA